LVEGVERGETHVAPMRRRTISPRRVRLVTSGWKYSWKGMAVM